MVETMRAAVYEGNGKLVVQDVVVPSLHGILAPKKFEKGYVAIKTDDTCLIEVEAAGICGTDFHILEGKHGSSPPIILGHEYIGRVVDTGWSVTHIQRGDRVAVDPNIKCGVCEFCRNARPNMCRNMSTLGIFMDGGFARYNLVPAKQLYRLPEEIPSHRAVFFEPLACVMHGLEKVRPRFSDRVLIYGGGTIGCLFALSLSLSGIREIIVIEPSELRKSYAFHMGARSVIHPSQEEKKIRASDFDLVIDAAGASGIVPHMIEYARPGARLLLFGQQNVTVRDTASFTMANQKELEIHGSYAASYSFNRTIETLCSSNPRIKRLEYLVSHTLGVDDIHCAMELLKTGNALKVVITPGKVK